MDARVLDAWAGLDQRHKSDRAAVPPCRRAAVPPCRRAAVPPCRRAAVPPCRRAAVPPCRRAAVPPCRRAAEISVSVAMLIATSNLMTYYHPNRLAAAQSRGIFQQRDFSARTRSSEGARSSKGALFRRRALQKYCGCTSPRARRWRGSVTRASNSLCARCIRCGAPRPAPTRSTSERSSHSCG